MNKSGFSTIEKVGFGAVIGIAGLIFMSFGAVIPNIILLRIGIVATTVGGWLISWKT